jgi:stage II sporulation protein R
MVKKLAALTIFIIFIISGIYIASAQESKLTDSVLRLHVIANSDDPADQALKLAVKDEIVRYMRTEFTDVTDVAEAKALAQKDRSRIREIAEQKIKSCGYQYPVEVYVGAFDFPVKSYGNMVFPSGKYQAVRVVIGKGEGKNWWCVLFPPLCLVSSSDRGMSLHSVQEAQITFKCLELLRKGVRVVNQ